MRTRLAPLARVMGAIVLLLLALAAVFLPLWPGAADRFAWWGTALLGVRIYASFLVLLGVFFAWRTRRPGRGFGDGMVRAFHWLRAWHGWLALMVLTGGILGMLLFPLGAVVFGVDRALNEVVLAGLRDGSFYFLIWAPGAAFVLCFMEAHDRVKKDLSPPGGLDSEN